MDAATRLVSEIMQTDFVTVSLHDRLDFADQVMRLGRIRHLPVLHQGRVVGIVSNRDILAAFLTKVLQFGPIERRAFLRSIDVEEVMTSRIYRSRRAPPWKMRHSFSCDIRSVAFRRGPGGGHLWASSQKRTSCVPPSSRRSPNQGRRRLRALPLVALEVFGASFRAREASLDWFDVFGFTPPQRDLLGMPFPEGSRRYSKSSS